VSEGGSSTQPLGFLLNHGNEKQVRGAEGGADLMSMTNREYQGAIQIRVLLGIGGAELL
jgi:hypothetical protein